MQNIIIRVIFIIILFGISKSEDIDKAMDFYMQGELCLLSEDLISAENYFKEVLNTNHLLPRKYSFLLLIENSLNIKDLSNLCFDYS